MEFLNEFYRYGEYVKPHVGQILPGEKGCLNAGEIFPLMTCAPHVCVYKFALLLPVWRIVEIQRMAFSAWKKKQPTGFPIR